MKDSININNFDFQQIKQQETLSQLKRQQFLRIRISPVKNLIANLGKVNKIVLAKSQQRNSQQVFNSISVNKIKTVVRTNDTISSNQAFSPNKCSTNEEQIFRISKNNRVQMHSESQINPFPKKKVERYVQKYSLNFNQNQLSKQLCDYVQKKQQNSQQIADYQKSLIQYGGNKAQRYDQAQNKTTIKKKLSYAQKLQSCIMSTSLFNYKESLIRKPCNKLENVVSIRLNNNVKKPITLPKLKTEGQQQLKSPVKKQRALISCLQKDFEVIKAGSYIVMQKETKQILVGDKYKVSLQIASLTKIMTFFTVIKIGKELKLNLRQQTVIVDQDIQGFPGTSADLYYGQKYTIENLLYGLMLPSGNDAAMCLARWCGDKLKKDSKKNSKIKFFIQQMNKCAKQLELQNTRFGNPHGLPHADSSSTVYDVAKLSSVCMEDSLFREVVKTRNYKCKIENVKNKRRFFKIWQNTNKLLRRKNFIGIKTGITVTAGPCLASAYLFRQKTYIVVVAKCNKVSRRFKQTRYLLSLSLKQMYNRQLTEAEQKTLRCLYKPNADVDSDYSEQQRQFNYKFTSKAQYKRRASIICNQT